LGIGRGDIKLPDQLNESVWNTLADDVVLHGAELVADSRLNLWIEAALLAQLLYFLHDIIHASPRVKLMYLHGYSLKLPLNPRLLAMANSKSAKKFRGQGNFSRLGA